MNRASLVVAYQWMPTRIIEAIAATCHEGSSGPRPCEINEINHIFIHLSTYWTGLGVFQQLRCPHPWQQLHTSPVHYARLRKTTVNTIRNIDLPIVIPAPHHRFLRHWVRLRHYKRGSECPFCANAAHDYKHRWTSLPSPSDTTQAGPSPGLLVSSMGHRDGQCCTSTTLILGVECP